MDELSYWKDYVELKNALRNGKFEIVKSLIESGAKVNADPDNESVTTPLHLAIELGSLEIVKLLIHKGASVSASNENGEIPLFLAIKIGKYDIADYLLSLEHGYNGENYFKKENFTPLHIACITNNLNLVKKFIERGECINLIVNEESQYWPGFTPLHFAVQYNNIEIVQFLLNCGADFIVKNKEGLTPLHLAYKLKRGKVIDLILTAHVFEIANPADPNGLSHFHIACTRNDATIVQRFITHGADINSAVSENLSNLWSYTPLYLAVHHECTEVVKLLLTYNVPLIFHDRNILEEAYKTRNKEIVDIVLSKEKFKNKNIDRKLKSLSYLGDLNSSKVFSRQTPKPEDLNWAYWTGFTFLHVSVKFKTSELIESICLEDKTLIIKKDYRGRTPLHLAFEMKQTEIVDLILKSHESISDNPVDHEGLSHFHISCSRSNIKVINYLIDTGVDINSPVPTNSKFWPGYTPMHFAIEFEQRKVFKLLLDKNGDFLIKNKDGLTPFDLAISKFDIDDYSLACIIESILLKVSEKNITSFNDHGFTLLHMSCIMSRIEIVERYLELQPETLNKQVSWSKSKYFQYTPLEFVFYHLEDQEHLNTIVDLFLKKGVDVFIRDHTGTTLLHKLLNFSSFNGNVNKSLLDLANLDDLNAKGQSYFHTVCKKSNFEIAKYFIEKGVDINQRTKFKNAKFRYQTPLHLAVNNYVFEEDFIKLLLDNGADVNARDAALFTPLHLAVNKATFGTIRMLLKHKAEVNSQNLYNETPLHLVSPQANYKVNIVDLLLKYGADINIEDDEGQTPITKIPLDAYSRVNYEKYTIIMKHLKKLYVLGHNVSDKNLKHYQQFACACVENSDDFKDSDYLKSCLTELEQLKNVYVDKYTSLYNILFKNLNQMSFHSENDNLKKIIEAEEFHKKFSNYGFLIELQFKRGQARMPSLQKCRNSFKFLSVISLPDSCLDNIFQYLSDKDLENIFLSEKFFEKKTMLNCLA